MRKKIWPHWDEETPWTPQGTLFIADEHLSFFSVDSIILFLQVVEIYSEQLPVLKQDVRKSSAVSKIGHKYPDPSPSPQSTALISSLDCGSSSRHSQMPRTLCHQEINFTGKGAQLATDCKGLWKWKSKYSISVRLCYHSEGKKPSA